ncbi:MAG TPA: hypothetical protein PLB38_02425 [bacterium]|nr:hypothetical protein [bacterium]
MSNYRETHHFTVLTQYTVRDVFAEAAQSFRKRREEVRATLELLLVLPWQDIILIYGEELRGLPTRLKEETLDYYHLLKDEDPWRVSAMRV